MNMTGKVEATQSSKPEIMKYYNKTKGLIESRTKASLEPHAALRAALCMPSVEARSTDRMVMRNCFLQAAVEMVLGWHTATPPEGTATNSKEPHGSGGATPIVGSCYVCRRQKQKRHQTRKISLACVQPVCDEHSDYKEKGIERKKKRRLCTSKGAA
ncbi:unnamed protein product [Clavelina lepadiformis]|uniref:Uncharacterized protein n=1 Tax=Clavelina lepadiformis TaxID=159417 RepID=A0ABP0GRC7_CLALP